MNDRILRIISILSVLIVLIVVIMGALVTNTGSATGCGANWPLCYGKVIPKTQHAQTWIEFSHRVVSALAAILVVVQAVWVWIRLGKVRETKFLAISSVFFIFLQAFLGAAAVVWGQSSFVLAIHFGVSLLSFASVLLIGVVVYEETKFKTGRIVPNVSPGMRWNLILLTIYSFILVYSGAFVRHTNSSLGCTDFPLCNGQLIPPLISKAGFQFIHRFLALVIVIWLVATLIATIRHYKQTPGLSLIVVVSIIFVLFQAISGIFILKTHMALAFLLLHAFFVTCFFGLLTILLMLSLRKDSHSASLP